jgi:hypothetical protein
MKIFQADLVVELWPRGQRKGLYIRTGDWEGHHRRTSEEPTANRPEQSS